MDGKCETVQSGCYKHKTSMTLSAGARRHDLHCVASTSVTPRASALSLSIAELSRS